ncbi:MAG: hypothetical protein ACE5G5_08615 [Candidatus Methylomirabilales bacterium]
MYRYLILALALTGCASSPSAFTRPADVFNPVDYTHSYDALFAELFWRCMGPGETGVNVEGYAVASMRNSIGLVNFQVRLTARDSKGSALAVRSAWGDRLSASQFEPVPFQISVPAVGEGVRYDVYYSFRVPEPGERMAQPHFGTVEDVCRGRWRRKAIPPAS